MSKVAYWGTFCRTKIKKIATLGSNNVYPPKFQQIFDFETVSTVIGLIAFVLWKSSPFWGNIKEIKKKNSLAKDLRKNQNYFLKNLKESCTNHRNILGECENIL